MLRTLLFDYSSHNIGTSYVFVHPCSALSLLRQCSAKVLAEAFITLETSILQQLSPAELHADWADPDTAPNIVSLAQLFNKVIQRCYRNYIYIITCGYIAMYYILA